MNGTGIEFQNFKINRDGYTIEVQDLKTDQHQALELHAPSGFGKTSVLRAFLGFQPHEGEIFVQGIRLRDLPIHKRRIGMVFQDQVLFTHQNAVENAMSGLILQGSNKKDAETAALHGLERFGIRDRAFARVGELSGGERQRVAILRATLWKPDLLILDEPFQGLDATNRDLIKQYLSNFIREHPVPMIWVDHQADFKGLKLIGSSTSGKVGSERRIFTMPRA